MLGTDEKYPVLHLIDSAGMYGAEKVVLTLLQEVKDSRFPGILGCIRERETEIPEIASRASDLGIPVTYFTMNRGISLKGINYILKYIRNRGFYIVHSHGYKPDIFLSILPNKKFKTVSTVHGWVKQSGGTKSRIYEFINAIALNRMDKIIGVSKAVMADIVERGVREEKIELIYNGIKFDCSKPMIDLASIRRKYNLSHNALLIGAVGRLVKVKGHAYLIEAMPSILDKIKNCQLVIAGEGPLKKELLLLIKKYNLSDHVKLIGYTKQIKEFIAMIDIFIMPSLSEGLPMALLEAMAYGKPVLASSVGGIREVINSDEGILIPPADSNALSQAVMNLIADVSLVNKLSTSGRKRIETNFSAKNMALQYLSLYSEII